MSRESIRPYSGLDRTLAGAMESEQPLHPQHRKSSMQEPMGRILAVWVAQDRRAKRLSAMTSRAPRQLSTV